MSTVDCRGPPWGGFVERRVGRYQRSRGIPARRGFVELLRRAGEVGAVQLVEAVIKAITSTMGKGTVDAHT